jgi:hypothetical protein
MAMNLRRDLPRLCTVFFWVWGGFTAEKIRWFSLGWTYLEPDRIRSAPTPPVLNCVETSQASVCGLHTEWG